MSKFYDKTAASFKSTTIDTKVLDAQKILIMPAGGSYNERVDILDVVDSRVAVVEEALKGEYAPKIFTSNDTGNSNETEGIAIQFSKSHFVPASVKVTKVSLPYTSAVQTLTSQYCHIQYYNDQNQVIATHISEDTQDRTQGQTGISTWTFSEDIVPEDYAYVRILVSGANTPVTFGTTSKYRINVVNRGGVDFDTDECCVWTNTSSSPNYLGDITVGYNILQTTSQKITEVQDYVDDQLNNLQQDIEEQLNNVEDYIQEVDSDLSEIQEVIYGPLTPKSFDTAQFADGTDNAGITGFQLSKAHFINDAYITSFSIPYNYSANTGTNTGYLCLQVYSDDQTIATTGYSSDSRTANVSGSNKVTFPFDNFYIPKDYKFISVSIVANKTVTPNIPNNTGTQAFRAIVLKKSGSTTFDNDECQCYVNVTRYNWLIQSQVEYLQSADGIKDKVEQALTKEEADSLYLAKTEYLESINNYVTKEELNQQLEDLEPQDIDTSNLAKLNTSNTFTGDIVLRGGKLILANGSQLEIEEGDYIPGESGTNMAPSITQLQQDVEQLRTDMTQADSSLQNQIDNIPNLTDDVNDLTQRVIDLEQGNSGGSVASDYTKVKEDVEYHLQNEISHLSFTERLVMENLYTVEESSFSRYYSSNSVDNVTEFTDAVCSSFTLHKPSILLDATLGVLQIPYSGSAQVQCSLKIVCYDSNTKTNLVEATSINVVDYSTGAGNANFFFQPFTLPFKTEEVVCSFIKADGTNVQAPVKLVTTTPTNGDQYNNQNTYVDGRVYVIQYTNAVHINTFIRDLDDCRWPMLELMESGSYSIAFDTFVGMRSISLNPHPETGNSIVIDNLGLGLNNGFTAVNGDDPTFFSCLCIFTSMTEEAYVKLNGHTLYTGKVGGGLSFSDQLSFPFQIDMLLGPGDTIEISPYVQLRAIRFTGGRYV